MAAEEKATADVATPNVIALVRDLMFSSKITATAKAAQTAVKIVRDPAQLGATAGRLLLVDLNQPGGIDAAGAWLSADASRRAIGFVSHVDTQAIAAARAVGIIAMPRSRFVTELPALLGEPSNIKAANDPSNIKEPL